MIKIGKKKTLKEHWNESKDKFEEGWYKAYPWVNLVATFVMFILLGFIAMTLFTKVEIETEGQCNSGNINLDIEVDNLIQEHPCFDMKFHENGSVYYTISERYPGLSCFKEDYLLNHVNLKGIENLNCEGSVKVKMPLIMTLFMGDRDEW